MNYFHNLKFSFSFRQTKIFETSFACVFIHKIPFTFWDEFCIYSSYRGLHISFEKRVFMSLGLSTYFLRQTFLKTIFRHILHVFFETGILYYLSNKQASDELSEKLYLITPKNEYFVTFWRREIFFLTKIFFSSFEIWIF